MWRGLVEIGVGLLDGVDGLDLGEPADRLGLDVHDHARGDVVGDDRAVGGLGDRLEVRDDPALRRLVVVRRDDEQRVDAERGGLLGEMDRVRGRVGAGAGDDGGAVADRFDRGAEEVEPLGVGQGRALARSCPATTIPSEPLSTRCAASAWNASKSTAPSGANGVTIAVRTFPSTPESLRRSRWILARCDSCSCTAPGTAGGASRRWLASSPRAGTRSARPIYRATTSRRTSTTTPGGSGRSRTRSSSDTRSVV